MFCSSTLKFLSTPSARRATGSSDRSCPSAGYFYPRPPRGGRPVSVVFSDRTPVISIHALREEGDLPQARFSVSVVISIHALREEGDPGMPRPLRTVCGISIHALREEGDILTCLIAFRISISIHALREEGDSDVSCFLRSLLLFLSTPSARRATAKTETKSLFSNKLYNILHEFRRALIYNGSKNYPNHAK